MSPTLDKRVELGAVDPGAGFEAPDYVGAIEPGGDNWTLGWTHFGF